LNRCEQCDRQIDEAQAAASLFGMLISHRTI
jgi:hypothetical protein